jgi:hypothetical protein
MSLRIAVAGLIAAVSLPASHPAWSAPGDALADPEAVVVAELVIRAPVAGPAWWAVRRDEAVVQIMGLPDQPLPRGLAWEQTVFERRLASADALILPVAASAGLGDVPALLRLRRELRSQAPLEDGLSPPLRARFIAARESLRRPASRYAAWGPLFAGQKLVDDFHRQAGTKPGEPMATIRTLARRAKVPARPAANYRAVAILGPAIGELTPEAGEACLTDAVTEVEAGAGRLTDAAKAWAAGDVAGVLAGPRGFGRCLRLLSGGEALWRRTVEQQADAVEAALTQPGRTVAVMSIRSLVARDGVLDRLRARGFTVTPGG